MNEDFLGEESAIREYARERIEKELTYTRDYLDLCLQHDVVPLSKEEFIDKYVEVLTNAENMKERAELYQEQDKMDLFDMLEENGRPDPDDVALIESFPCIMYTFLNVLEEGVIALLILFEGKEMIICPVFFDKNSEEMELPPEADGVL